MQDQFRGREVSWSHVLKVVDKRGHAAFSSFKNDDWKLHSHSTAVLHFVRLLALYRHHDAKKRDYYVATSTATRRNHDMAATANIGFSVVALVGCGLSDP